MDPSPHRYSPGAAGLLAAFLALVAVPSTAALLDREIFGRVLPLLGGVVGIAALSMLLLQFLSSGRFAWLTDGPGIDRTMRFHQLAGRVLALLALAHVALAIGSIATRSPAGWSGAAKMMLSSPFFASGTAALVLLVVLVALGMLRTKLPWRYELWRAGHLAGALLVAGLATHHALAVGVTSSRPAMLAYWGLLAGVAAAAIVWVHGIKPMRLGRRPFTVARNLEAADGVREIVLEPAGGEPLRYRAGQFAWVLIGQPRLPLLDHPFSIASSPRAGRGLRLLVKSRGDFTRRLAEVPVGARAWIDGPFGHFTLAGRQGDSIAMFAGGIGIAPILGLLEELRLAGDRRPVSLVYGVACQEELVGLDSLAEAARALDLRARLFVERPSGRRGAMAAGSMVAELGALEFGRPTPQAVADALRGDPASALCFLCGPPAMMRALSRQLRELGVPSDRIVFERFEYD